MRWRRSRLQALEEKVLRAEVRHDTYKKFLQHQRIATDKQVGRMIELKVELAVAEKNLDTFKFDKIVEGFDGKHIPTR